MNIVFFTEKEVESDDFIMSCYAGYCRARKETPKNLKIDRSTPKPKFTCDGVLCPPYFSLSHSDKLTVCSIGEKPVGVDVQKIKKVDYARISERFFGTTITNQASFFNEFTKGEATIKLYEIPFTEGMKRREGKNYNYFKGYAFAMCGDTPFFFSEVK